MSESKKISRSSFLGSLGALGALGAIPFLATGCSEEKVERVVYEGENKDAILDNILTRRSVRKYTDQEVKQEDLDRIMRCAIFSPSAVNAQPWEVRVVQNPEILEEISKRHVEYLRSRNQKTPNPKDYSAIYHAPVFIIIAREKKSKGTLSNWMDCGIILQTILLAAHGLNLATCPMAAIVPFLNDERNVDLLDLISIPEEYEIAVTAALGYPDESPEVPIRYSDKVKYIR